jgi:hypothetical protein
MQEIQQPVHVIKRTFRQINTLVLAPYGKDRGCSILCSVAGATRRSGSRRIIGTESTIVPPGSRVTPCKAAMQRAGVRVIGECVACPSVCRCRFMEVRRGRSAWWIYECRDMWHQFGELRDGHDIVTPGPRNELCIFRLESVSVRP